MLTGTVLPDHTGQPPSHFPALGRIAPPKCLPRPGRCRPGIVPLSPHPPLYQVKRHRTGPSPSPFSLSTGHKKSRPSPSPFFPLCEDPPPSTELFVAPFASPCLQLSLLRPSGTAVSSESCKSITTFLLPGERHHGSVSFHLGYHFTSPSTPICCRDRHRQLATTAPPCHR
jgi:hypothetical protein